MYPQTYFLVALLIAVIAAKFGFLTMPQAFIAAAIAVLVDLDHFFLAYARNRSFREAWRNAVDTHTDETFLHSMKGFLTFILVKAAVFVFSSTWALMLAIAYWSHLFLDTVHILLRDAAQKHFSLTGANFAVRATIAELTLEMFSLLMSVLYLQFT